LRSLFLLASGRFFSFLVRDPDLVPAPRALHELPHQLILDLELLATDAGNPHKPSGMIRCRLLPLILTGRSQIEVDLPR
jgi:hypothetical protein